MSGKGRGFQESKFGGAHNSSKQHRGPTSGYSNRGPTSGYSNRGPTSGYSNRDGPSQNRGRFSDQQQNQPIDPALERPLTTIDAVDNVQRNWVGKAGQECELITNYFNLNMKPITLYRYYVDIQDFRQPAVEKAGKQADQEEDSKGRLVMNRFLNRYVLWTFLKDKELGKRTKFVYDDHSTLFSTIDILGDNDETYGMIECVDSNLNENKRFHVTIRSKSQVQADRQTLNLIITQLCRHPFGPFEGKMYCEIDRRFLERPVGFEPLGIGKCLELLRGLNSAVKSGPGEKKLVNYDLKHSTFLKENIPLLEFYALSKGISLPPESEWNTLSMNKVQRKELNFFLKGMLVSRTYGDDHFRNRNIRLVKVIDKTACSATIHRDNTEQTIEEYFSQRYNIRLRCPNLPLIQVGKPDQNICIPMELLNVADKRQRLRRKLPDDLQALTTQYTTVKPLARFNMIKKMMAGCKVGEDWVAKEFEVSIDLKFLKVKGRVLPNIKVYHRTKDQKAFVDRITINMAVVNVNNAFRRNEVLDKTNKLMNECSKFGLHHNGPIVYKDLDLKNKPDIRQFMTELKEKVGKNSLTLVILNDNENKETYYEMKYYGDLVVGLRTQCIKRKTFSKIGGPFTLHANLFKKMYGKMGGASMRVDRNFWPEFTNSKEPTLFIGVDVTHPAPGDESFPSIAACVGNLDLDATRYGATLRIQTARSEEVLSIGGMFVERMKEFYKANSVYPQKVVYLRDGVANSQFDMVNGNELKAMRRACKKAAISIPKFTVIIVQKRHTTRFYNETDGDQNGNVLPGTVVDRFITNEQDKQFFLCAHKGLLGTSKPINYWVIHDDSNFSADSIQRLANLLCNVFTRASGPVSIPAPVFYAHLTCFRARDYANYLRSKGDTVDENMPERFAAHPDLKDLMYFS